MGEVKILKRKIEVEDFYAICPKCKKEIRGSSENSVKNNIQVHLNTRHKREK